MVVHEKEHADVGSYDGIYRRLRAVARTCVSYDCNGKKTT